MTSHHKVPADLPADLIDLDRWPVADPASPPAAAVVRRARSALADQGFALLPGFLRPQAVARLRAEADGLMDRAHAVNRFRPAGQVWPDSRGDWRLPADYVQRYASVPYDAMAADSGARRLYQWSGLTCLIGAIIGDEPLYPMDDPAFACLLHVMRADDRLDWHFDPNDAVATLTLDAPASGGEFEIAPGVRDGGEETPAMAARLQDVVSGRWPAIHQVAPRPGDLLVFQGHMAMHRVREIGGAAARRNLVWSYTSLVGEGFTGDRTAYGA
ncbi:MAG: hypothetical protein RIE31_07255 [Alphaproteobacteria bacterium]